MITYATEFLSSVKRILWFKLTVRYASFCIIKLDNKQSKTQFLWVEVRRTHTVTNVLDKNAKTFQAIISRLHRIEKDCN